MSTSYRKPDVAEALLGKVRSAVLALLFLHTDELFYHRQLVRMTGLGHGAVQRELGHLLQAGLLIRTQRGKEVYYQANQSSPIYAELRGLFAALDSHTARESIDRM
ncbi:MAG: hypothetical protein ACYC7E_11245 [Armatimonadota bacterium]